MRAMPNDADVAELTRRAKRLPPADRRALTDELVISLDSDPAVDLVAHVQASADEQMDWRCGGRSTQSALPPSKSLALRPIAMAVVAAICGKQMSRIEHSPQRLSLTPGGRVCD